MSSAMVGHARFSPWQFTKADLQMGHLLELALIASPATKKESCDPNYLTRTRIEGSFEGRMNPEQPCEHAEANGDIVEKYFRRWDRARMAPDQKRLSPSLLGPSIYYYGLEKPQSQLGGFFRPP